MKKKESWVTLPPEMEAKLDVVGKMKEKISQFEKEIKPLQKTLVSYVKRHKLQPWPLRASTFKGIYMAKQNERISKTKLKGMLSERLIDQCTDLSKRYEWIKTSRIRPKRSSKR